jgi:hypothetical protein
MKLLNGFLSLDKMFSWLNGVAPSELATTQSIS